jgi:hypothetical protein
MYGGREVSTGFWWGKIQHRKLRYIWKDTVKIEFHKVGFVGRDWIDLVQDY